MELDNFNNSPEEYKKKRITNFFNDYHLFKSKLDAKPSGYEECFIFEDVEYIIEYNNIKNVDFIKFFMNKILKLER